MTWPILTAVSLAALAVVLGYGARRRTQVRADLAAARQEAEALRAQMARQDAAARAQRETLFDPMTEGVLILDPAGRVEFANRAVGRLFGLSAEPRGRTLLEAFRRPELTDLFERVQAGGEVERIELAVRDATERWLEVNATAFREAADGPPGVLLVLHDFTRLKALERARREFVANVSHELRTPLSLIKGFVETLLDGAHRDPAVAPRFLQTIARHTDRLTFLIEDLLTLSQLESGQAALNLQAVELLPVVERVVHDLGPRAAEARVRLVNAVPPELTARADADRLQQVLWNLVDNALKYGASGGRVDLGAAPGASGQLECWVRDAGPGVPAEAAERVFERFYRLDPARARDQGGTGLGLAIVKHIVQSHGGQVRVDSPPGGGATFRFTLPAYGVSLEGCGPSSPAPAAPDSGLTFKG